MSNEDNTNEAPEGAVPTDRRPLGFWLRIVDNLITVEFDNALAAEGVTRRDWMLLNALAGSVDVPGFAEKMARRNGRLSEFEDRGWVIETGSGWELTDEGRAEQERLADTVQSLRERVAGAVSPEDFASLTASLEAIARELGWDEDMRMPRGRGFGRGRGFMPGFGFGAWPGFGPWGGFGPGAWGGFGPGFDPRSGFGPGFGPHRGFGPGFGPHRHHGHHPGDRGGKGRGGKDERRAERAYERGFTAGFDAARRGERAQPEASGTTV